MMTNNTLFQSIDDRIRRDRDESDYTYFNTLTLKFEYLTKIITSGIVSCIGDDIDRNRYSLEHKLVRANSLGSWTEVLNTALNGPPSELLIHSAYDLAGDLTERVGNQDWRFSAVETLNRAAIEVDVDNSQLGAKVALRQFFDIGVQIRNRTRGHGATTIHECSSACLDFENALTQVIDNIKILSLSWAYLHKNLSGKYRVSMLLNDTSPFEYLKRTKDARFQDGVYFSLDDKSKNESRLIYVPLIFTDPDVRDIAVPNGDFVEKKTNFRGDFICNKFNVPPRRFGLEKSSYWPSSK